MIEYPNGTDSPGHRLDSRLYVDGQLRFTPHWMSDGFGFAIGVNNLFDKDPPGCITCGLNNMDPTTYDVPGRYYYARVSVQMGASRPAPPPYSPPPPPPPPAAEPLPPPPPPPAEAPPPPPAPTERGERGN